MSMHYVPRLHKPFILIDNAMAFIGSHNRFNEFRDDFVKDTGFQNVEDNMDLYIQYVIARFADQNHRLLTDLRNGIQDLYKVLRKV